MKTPGVLKKMARSVIVALVIIFLSTFLCTSARADSSCEKEMERVRKTADWTRIRTTANRLLERNPDNQYCIQCLVEADIQMKRFVDARANLIRLREHGKQLPYLWALLEYLVGNYKEADKYVVAMLATGAHSPVVLELSEKIAYKVDRQRWIQLCAKHQKLDHASWYLSGGTSGDHEKAFSEVNNLYKNREHAMLHVDEFLVALISPLPKAKLTADEQILVANSHLNLYNEASALDWCEPVALVRTKETLTIMNGLAFMRFKSHDRVRHLLDKMEGACTNDWRYWYIRSQLSRQQGRIDEALRHCNHSLALSSNEANLWMRFTLDSEGASLSTSKDARSRLLTDLDPLVRNYPSVRSFTERARVFHEQELYEEELQDLAHLMELLPPGPEKLQVQMRMAEGEYTVGNLRAAKKTAELVLRSQPDNARCRSLLDRIQKEMKRASIKD